MRQCLLAGFVFLIFGAVAGDARAAATPADAALTPEPPVAIRMPPAPWKAIPAWVDAPEGQGQYLLVPSPAGQFEVGDRQYVATSFGVLVRPKPAGGPSRCGTRLHTSRRFP